MSRSNIRWPSGHSEGAATGGVHGSQWGRNPPRQFIGESFAISHPRQKSNGARQNRRATPKRLVGRYSIIDTLSLVPDPAELTIGFLKLSIFIRLHHSA